MARPKKTTEGIRKTLFFWDYEQLELCQMLLRAYKQQQEAGKLEKLDKMTIGQLRKLVQEEKNRAEQVKKAQEIIKNAKDAKLNI